MSGNSLGAGGGFNQFQQNNNQNVRKLNSKPALARIQKQTNVKTEQKAEAAEQNTQTQDSFQDTLSQKESLRDRQKVNFDLRKQISSKKKTSNEQARLTEDPADTGKQEQIASFVPRVRKFTQKQTQQTQTQDIEQQESQDGSSLSEDADNNQSLAKDLGQSDQSIEKYKAFHKPNAPEKKGRTNKVKNLLAEKKKAGRQRAQEKLYESGKKLPIEGLGLGTEITKVRYSKGYIASLNQQAKGEEAFRVAKGLVGVTNDTEKTEKDLLLSEANFSPFKFNAITTLRQKNLKHTKGMEKTKPPEIQTKAPQPKVGEAVYEFLVDILSIELPWDMKLG